MNSLRQRCGPKHQILVLKCYPRHQKHNPDLKPNSSELSYLLYYASTRRSKLQKVGDFLDKKVVSDVWNVRIGNVQVSLQIIKALIEKCPRDLPLYAAASLRIFKTILKSLDVTMIEEAVPTWATFCAHQDPAILAADQDYIRQYEEIVQYWAEFASKDTPVQHKSAKSLPVRIRFRKAGLAAIKAIAESDALSSETSRQLGIIIPPILENIYADDGHYLIQLEQVEEERLEIEKEIAFKRRQSTSTAEPLRADAAAASGSIEAADRLAELETGVIALQALKTIFGVVPRSQLRLATSKVLKFMGDRIKPREHFPSSTIIPLQSGSWPCMLFGKICSWAPVQDRFGILLTAVEELLKCPLREEECERQYVLATITGWLLSSEINFIGLSIMDVLMGLLQHMLALLHSDILIGTSKDEQSLPSELNRHMDFEGLYPQHPTKLQLLIQLEKCIGCLAVHVYYTDQVSDMVAAIFSRLKPRTVESGTPPDPVGSTTSLVRKNSLEGGFSSSSVSKVAALRCIKEILVWANWTKPDGTSTASPRSKIPIEKWQGTQWLLQDDSWEVRFAYVDILLIWMRTELKRSDLRAPGEPKRQSSTRDKKEAQKDSLTKRAVSNASHRDKSPPRSRSTFLPLLHLAVYDNSHRFSESKKDILLLHLLLSNLVANLGVNSVQHGLPMIARLQEDIVDVEDLPSKINLGSLVYGYLWALSVSFHFDASATGREIIQEISNRMNLGLWLQSLQVPSIPLEEIVNKAGLETSTSAGPEQMIMFEGFANLVNKIAEGYKVSLYSPPSSPPTSPLRKFATPENNSGFFGGQVKTIIPSEELPTSVKEAMTSNWTREIVITANSQQDGSRSASLSGTTPATNGSARAAQHLSVTTGNPQPNGEGLPSSPRRSQLHHSHHLAPSPFRPVTSRPNSAAHARDAVYQQGQQPSAIRDALLINTDGAPRSRTSHAGTPFTTSSVRSSVRVEDLKRVLHGAIPPPLSRGRAADEDENEGQNDGASVSDESMVSYEGSEPSLGRVDANGNGKVVEGVTNQMEEAETEDEEDIPPVPPLPEGYQRRPSTSTQLSSSPQSPISTRQSAVNSPSGGSGAVAIPKTKFPPSALTGSSKAETIRSANVRESLRRSISTRDGTLPIPITVPVQPTISVADSTGQTEKLQHPLQQHPVNPLPTTVQRTSSRHGKAPAAGPPTREGLGTTQNAWSALDLLDSIDAEGVAATPGSGVLIGNGTKGRGLKPPY